MVAIYLRVSTTDQQPETQARELREFATLRRWEIVETYEDIGISGAKARRPGLDRLLKDAWRGKFQAVLVWDLSRIARSTLNALQLLEQFSQMKLRFISIKQTFDTETPLGKAFFTLAAMFAELERSILVERVRAGMNRAKQEGKRIGRPAVTIDLEKAQRLKDQGLSIRQIAAELNVPKSTLAKRLTAGNRSS